MATHPIRFGVQTGQQMVEWKDLLDLWVKCDAWGYDTLWNFDHFFPIFLPPDGPCLEAWTTLAALAQATKRARVGTLVLGNTYRNPALTAKMAATLDHVSGGRFILGIGAGWFEQEHRAFGIDFKTVPRRLEALDESLRIVKRMLAGEKTSFEGRHYSVADAYGSPPALQRPHPPILIGGTGKKKLLRIVAEHADLWNATGNPDRMKELVDAIAAHGEAIGRDPAAIEKTVGMLLCYRGTAEREAWTMQVASTIAGTTPEEARKGVMIGGQQQCLEKIEAYRRVGITHFIFMTLAPYALDEIQRFAEEVIPAARRLG